MRIVFIFFAFLSLNSFGFDKSVIGDDHRVSALGSSNNIGHVGTYCSGTLVAPDIVLTAAHCLYNQKYDQFLSTPYFRPARDGNTSPFGKFHWKKLYIKKAYAKEKDKASDIAFIVLQKKVSGIYSFPKLTTGKSKEDVSVSGYPKDKPFATAWKDECRAKRVDQFYLHSCDTAGGMSGSALINSKRRIVGVHVLGGDEFNKAIPITKYILSTFSKIKARLSVSKKDWLVYHNSSPTFVDEFDRVIMKNPYAESINVSLIYYDLERNEKRLEFKLSAFESREVFKTRRSKFYLRYESKSFSYPESFKNCQKFDELCHKKIVLKGANWLVQKIQLDLHKNK